MQKIPMRLSAHKREQLHCSNQEAVREMRIELMEEEEEEEVGAPKGAPDLKWITLQSIT